MLSRWPQQRTWVSTQCKSSRVAANKLSVKLSPHRHRISAALLHQRIRLAATWIRERLQARKTVAPLAVVTTYESRSKEPQRLRLENWWSHPMLWSKLARSPTIRASLAPLLRKRKSLKIPKRCQLLSEHFHATSKDTTWDLILTAVATCIVRASSTSRINWRSAHRSSESKWCLPTWSPHRKLVEHHKIFHMTKLF